MYERTEEEMRADGVCWSEPSGRFRELHWLGSPQDITHEVINQTFVPSEQFAALPLSICTEREVFRLFPPGGSHVRFIDRIRL